LTLNQQFSNFRAKNIVVLCIDSLQYIYSLTVLEKLWTWCQAIVLISLNVTHYIYSRMQKRCRKFEFVLFWKKVNITSNRAHMCNLQTFFYFDIIISDFRNRDWKQILEKNLIWSSWNKYSFRNKTNLFISFDVYKNLSIIYEFAKTDFKFHFTANV
jgi:hypothetical protein